MAKRKRSKKKRTWVKPHMMKVKGKKKKVRVKGHYRKL
jgi:hypothetical protein